MESKTKIHLSPFEKDLVLNKEWILTKRTIIKKVCEMFGNLYTDFREMPALDTVPSFLDKYFNRNGKISKGDNHEGFPYVILDYPVFFSKESVLAIRTFFWWGNFFSITLHVSGDFLPFSAEARELYDYLSEKSFYLCIGENEWRHSFVPENYLPVVDLNREFVNRILERRFCKISKKLDLDLWDQAPGFFITTFQEILEFLKISFPGDEKGL
jgi:hypothetical protein